MKTALETYKKTLDGIVADGAFKEERIITTPQCSVIDTTKAKRVVNMCANNYLGLSRAGRRPVRREDGKLDTIIPIRM